MTPEVRRLSRADLPRIVDVLADAFRDYPVMRLVLGEPQPYEPRLRRLVELFVSARVFRDEAMFGIDDPSQPGALIAAATTTRPNTPPAPAEFLALRDAVWQELGADARQRYDEYGRLTNQLAIPGPHYHLNMLGVRRAAQRRGLARPLLEAVHALADGDETSLGVSLSTELPANVPLYEHFGYRVRAHAHVGPLETWTLYRERGHA